jgi:hypothetical protein
MKLTGPYFIDSHAPEMAEQIRRTHVGQASWAGTGPPGETCVTCKFYGCWKQVRDAAGNVTRRPTFVIAAMRFENSPARSARRCRRMHRRANTSFTKGNPTRSNGFATTCKARGALRRQSR